MIGNTSNESLDSPVAGSLGNVDSAHSVPRPSSGRRGLLWLGLASSLAVVAAGAIAVGRASGHNLQSDTFSDIAAQDAERPLFMRSSMILFGLASALFGYGLGASRIHIHRAVQPLVIGFGSLVLLSGVFQDHSELPNVEHNLEGNVHNASGIIAISLMIVAMVISAEDQFSRTGWSLATLRDNALVFGAGAGGVAFALGPAQYQGAAEITVYVAILAWMFTSARAALSST